MGLKNRLTKVFKVFDYCFHFYMDTLVPGADLFRPGIVFDD
jgi:hypothetical protein